MTKIKLCGLRRMEDIAFANELSPDYIGFVFAKKSKRYVSPDEAEALRKTLKTDITPVGVFVNDEIDTIYKLIQRGVIDAVQLHGNEDKEYIKRLRQLTDAPIFQAFRIKSSDDIRLALDSTADLVLLDSGKGSGETFDHSLIKGIDRPYFLAGGLTPQNVHSAIKTLRPFAVDASSSLETDGFKDKEKMTAFTEAVRKADNDD